MSKRIACAPGLCAPGLALLAGCTFYDGEPDPPDPPPPIGTNLPADEYDPANHRLLVSDCPNHTLLAVDLATGQRSVLIHEWPWTEPDNEPCVERVVVDRDGTRAFATVSRVFPDPRGGAGAHCQATDLTLIDLETRAVTPLQNIDHNCCDDWCGADMYSSLQLDERHGRLLYLESDLRADYGEHYLSSTPFGTDQGAQLYQLYASDCLPDDERCAGVPWSEAEWLTFDPAAPEQRILVLSWRYLIGDYLGGEYLLDRIDVATGAITESLPLEFLEADFTRGSLAGLAVDTEKQRVLLTWTAVDRWTVFALDLVTGEETLLHDGPPADGARLECSPTTAFDSRERRLLLVESLRGGYPETCKNGVFAVDADTGAFTQVVPRLL